MSNLVVTTFLDIRLTNLIGITYGIGKMSLYRLYYNGDGDINTLTLTHYVKKGRAEHRINLDYFDHPPIDTNLLNYGITRQGDHVWSTSSSQLLPQGMPLVLRVNDKRYWFKKYLHYESSSTSKGNIEIGYKSTGNNWIIFNLHTTESSNSITFRDLATKADDYLDFLNEHFCESLSIGDGWHLTLNDLSFDAYSKWKEDCCYVEDSNYIYCDSCRKVGHYWETCPTRRNR